MSFANLQLTLYFIVAVLFSLSFHEAAHAYVADRLGDPTARYLGRLTLNPIAHLDLYGTIFMLIAVVSGWGLGWAKPVPFNPNNLRGSYRGGIGMVAAAGPVSNILLAFGGGIVALVMRAIGVSGDIRLFFIIFVITNLSLMLFNLIPLPPLDGSKVIFGILGRFRGQWAYNAGNWLMDLERYGPAPILILLVLNNFVPIISLPLFYVRVFVFSVLG